MNKPISIVLVLMSLLILATTTVVSAQVTASEVEIRGEVSQLISDSTFNINTWNAKNFAGFWYDVDEDLQTESLRIDNFDSNRSIKKDKLWYSTKKAPQKYKVFKEKGLLVEQGLNLTGRVLTKPTGPAKGGYYALVGWMAEKFVGVNNKNNKLSKMIIEQDATDKKTLQVGETWDIGDGYTLTAQSIDAKADPRQAWLVLSKNGNKLDDKVVAQGEVYTYSMDMVGENDVPIFVTYVDSVFAGQTSDMVQLKYTWAISTDVTEIKSGDKFGVFEVDNEQDPLRLKNTASVSLSRDSTVTIARNMKFKVADSDDNEVRFYPFVEISTPGNYEVRGTVSQLNKSLTGIFSVKRWEATNFAGFWYDIDDNQSTESLNIINFDGNRSIKKDNLIYETKKAPQKYKVFKEKGLLVEQGLNLTRRVLSKPTSPAKGGYYALVGWMAEKYVGVNNKNNKLSKMIIEQDATDKKTLQVGETWDIGDGYTLVAQSIDAKASPRQAWLVLNKDGNKLDDKVVAQGEVYTYSMDMAGENDVPIFVTYVDSVFAGQTSDMVQLKYTWAISTTITEVKTGDNFGVFEVDNEQDPLRLKNDASVSLSRDSTVDIAGNMKFKIADSDDNDVRFYPKLDVKIPTGNQTPAPTGNQTPAPTGNQTPASTGNQTPAPTGTGAIPPTEVQETPTTTQTEKKGTPGFEAIFAIAGIIAVAYIVIRQNR